MEDVELECSETEFWMKRTWTLVPSLVQLMPRTSRDGKSRGWVVFVEAGAHRQDMVHDYLRLIHFVGRAFKFTQSTTIGPTFELSEACFHAPSIARRADRKPTVTTYLRRWLLDRETWHLEPIKSSREAHFTNTVVSLSAPQHRKLLVFTSTHAAMPHARR